MDRVILIAAFIICAITIFIVVYMANTTKQEKYVNKVRFYVARDRDKSLWLYMGEPIRADDDCFMANAYGKTIVHSPHFKYFGLNEDNYKDLKWEDKPKEVFLNLED